MTRNRRRGLAAALLLVATAAVPAPAQGAQRFSVSLEGTWRTEATVTDTDCYRTVAGPEGEEERVPYTGNFTAVETGQLSTIRRGKAFADRKGRRTEVGSTGLPLRLRVALDRRSDVTGPCRPHEDALDTTPLDCGARDLRPGVGVFNNGGALSFGFVDRVTDPLGHSSYDYFPLEDPYANCHLADTQLWLGRLGDREGPGMGLARVSRAALMSRRRRKFVLRGTIEGHPTHDARNEEGSGAVTAVHYRLDWTMTLRRRGR